MSKDLGPVGRRQKELTNYEKWNKGPPATLQFFQHVFKRIALSAHSGLPSAPAGSLELPPRGKCSTQSSASCRKGSESRVCEIPKSQAALCAGGGVGAEQWLPAPPHSASLQPIFSAAWNAQCPLGGQAKGSFLQGSRMTPSRAPWLCGTQSRPQHRGSPARWQPHGDFSQALSLRGLIILIFFFFHTPCNGFLVTGDVTDCSFSTQAPCHLKCRIRESFSS